MLGHGEVKFSIKDMDKKLLFPVDQRPTAFAKIVFSGTVSCIVLRVDVIS